jgi:ATP-dependent HslUV protease ATP-binding subunit HslU
VEIDVREQSLPLGNVFHGAGLEDLEVQFKTLVKGIGPDRRKRRRMTVREARPLVEAESVELLLDQEKVQRVAVERAETAGIVFIDEIDKIAVAEDRRGGAGPDVSREGVQRDILPIVEGTSVMTRYGSIRTDRILFVGAGAFTLARPSDLIPELQGRFPIRVELADLTEADLRRILVEPKNAIVRQYQALLSADGVELELTGEALDEIAALAWNVNATSENIGARRLHTIVERLLEELMFEAPSPELVRVTIDRAQVRERLAGLVADQDLSRFIL